MNKKIILIASLVTIIIFSSLGGYWIGTRFKEEPIQEKSQKPDRKYVYYCEWDNGNSSSTLWVDPEHNDYPYYYVAKKIQDKYNYTLHPDRISCEKVYQPN
ncbi:hypothetical protein [Haloplasma contractile]|uniref:Uncharacterized protein n=1 Tax=Haloplasma contractile SSD-17B TaxID=1033810 RepID=U2E9Q7_9MOLU|nr:hypothetical protein [Haloplasma contractile]ERJ11868.1 hypothetical protein HLPCO_002108 [Haloplasma contractile SSD-17B]